MFKTSISSQNCIYMELTEFWTILSLNNIILEQWQLRAIERYVEELKYWNTKVNLISRKDIENALENHILHSIVVLKFLDIPNKSKCLDLGTGGGLPGIPLKIIRPDLQMIMIDSIAKKIKITQILASHIALKGIEAICIRAEEMAKNQKYKSLFDFVFTRAVGRLSTVLAWTKPLLKTNGSVVFFKGGDLSDEFNQAKKIFSNLKLQELLIRLDGYDKFEKLGKKIVVCKF